MAGQEAGTLRANQDITYGAIMGEDVDRSVAIWRSIADTTIENWSEAMGGPIMAGISKIPGTKALGGAIRAKAIGFLDSIGKPVKEGADRIAGIAALSRWLSTHMQKHGLSKEAMKSLSSIGYDGVFGEMMEERAGDWMRGLFGLEGDADENAIKRAFKNSLPDPEQLGVELIAFSMPAILVGGAHLAANAPNLDKWLKTREALADAANLAENRRLWEGQVQQGGGGLQPLIKTSWTSTRRTTSSPTAGAAISIPRSTTSST